MVAASSHQLPNSLNPAQLAAFTRFYAADVRSGSYSHVRYDERDRWHLRLYRDQRVDVWLISWLPSQATQLHDHGGSAGGFTLVTGELAEAVYAPARRTQGGLWERSHRGEDTVAFGSRYVHDVRNTSSAPAVSVHAYSPPLTSMTFLRPRGRRTTTDRRTGHRRSRTGVHKVTDLQPTAMTTDVAEPEYW